MQFGRAQRALATGHLALERDPDCERVGTATWFALGEAQRLGVLMAGTKL